mmetsp:Transcript_11436/g.36498  ORF Transcript_11436/g.36498 Transcript_11436/m.36498 type:complete len:258 (+) Transcript_11436:237-1010(+)
MSTHCPPPLPAGGGDGGGGEDCGNSANSGAAAGECGVGGGVSASRCVAQARGMHGGLVHPWGALLHEGVLYVSDVGGACEELPGRVVAIDASESLARIGSFGTGHLRLPAGLALLPARDDGSAELIVADHGAHCLRAFALPPSGGQGRAALPSDEPSRVIGGCGRAPGLFHAPVGVAVGRDRTIFVSEFSGRRVQALTAAGEPVAVFEPPGRSRLMGLAAGEAADGSVAVWVCDYDADMVHELALETTGRQAQADLK